MDQPGIARRLRKALRAILLAPAALILLFEEWGWEPLAAAVAAIGRLPLLRHLEGLIRRLPPWAALLAFGLPVVVLIPVKLLALYLFGKGHLSAGVGLIIGAKIVGTAVAARLFQLTQPALMRLPWFARLYFRWKRWKDVILNSIRSTLLWRHLRVGRRQMSRAGRRFLAMLKSAGS